MDKNTEKINLLLLKMENLMVRQQGFEAELKALRAELNSLQAPDQKITGAGPEPEPQQTIVPPKKQNISFTKQFQPHQFHRSDFEKFIGENLISKIGILVLIIGVGIGTKLAIDEGWVTPRTRIISGYLVGLGLMGLALKLKRKYESYSAVLLSGSMAILYFVTFTAHAYYQLIPQGLSFVLMVLFTGFTVGAAITYNRQVIAHIGLVGAYAVPILLNDGSGKVVLLLSYIGFINFGILVLAFRKYWKWLFYSSFTLTWTIFLVWMLTVGHPLRELEIALIFSSVYFLTFYLTNLAYKVSKKEPFTAADITILLLNSFVFYGIGSYQLFISANREMLGLFTCCNAIVHLLASLMVYRFRLSDKSVFYFTLSLVVTFATIAVPVQYDGNWVSIFWAVEAAALFYFGISKRIRIYEGLSFTLICLAFVSLLQDWYERFHFFNFTHTYRSVPPFLNVGFLCSCIFIAAFGLMFIMQRKMVARQPAPEHSVTRRILAYLVPALLIFITYFAFRFELVQIFENLYQQHKVDGTIYNEYYPLLADGVIYGYSFLFAIGLTSISLRYVKSDIMATANLLINLLLTVAFLTHGLYILSELRENYLGPGMFPAHSWSAHFEHGKINILIRYLLYGCFAGVTWSSYQLIKVGTPVTKPKNLFDYIFYLSILWISSSELLNILELNGLTTGYKLGLSILWGVYALLLIGLGLWKNKKHLRIGAIILFAITLAKLLL